MLKRILLFTFLLLTNFNFAQEDIVKNLDNFLADDASEQISVFVYDPMSMDTIYAKNIHESLIPASNVKLFTTATALNLLANRTDLFTRVFTDDEFISDSVINGNLYIKGFGDALFEEKDLDSLVTILQDLGIRKINGNIVGDETYFDNIYTRDDWITNEHANVTLPPISGLSLDRNKIVVKFSTSKEAGKIADYEIMPSGDFYNVSMNAKITKFKSNPRINLRTENDKINIRIDGGVRKKRYPYSYLVYPDSPAVYIAHLLKDKISKAGIDIVGKCLSGKTPLPSFELAVSTHPFWDLVDKVNKNSDNYLAENLFKILGAEYSQKEGNSYYATQAIMSFLDQEGIYNEGTTIVDGSGISRFNKTTTASIVSLLEFVYLDIDNFDFFYNSLSIAGRDGTLEDRMYESSAYQNFRGKTGSLNGVSSISGYLTTKNNRDLIVSILMNFRSKGMNHFRNLQDKIISYLAANL